MVKRYTEESASVNYHPSSTSMYENEFGEWVRYNDFRKTMEKVAFLMELVTDIADGSTNHSEDIDENNIQCAREFIEEWK
jgi:hypothetical protein